MGREEDSGCGTHVYLWRIHFDIWQNQYNIVKLKNKIKEINKSFRKKNRRKPLRFTDRKRVLKPDTEL